MEDLLCIISSKRKDWAFIIVLFIVGSTEADDLKFRCGPGINTPGVTIPSGDIIIEHGNPLEIYCVLNPTVVREGLNSSQLVFYHTSSKILPEFIKRINESTAQLYVEKPPPMSDMFYCKLQNGTEESPVCLNKVAVGFKPKEVLNFSCVSHNWDNLNCSWVPPQNYVKTRYTLYYTLRGRAVAKLKLPCPQNTDAKGKNYCYWDTSTETPYRQPYEYYNFVMTGENMFGNLTKQYLFHHYAYVIPTKPANLTYLERTTSSVLIQWSVVFPMQNFPPGVQQKVEYQSAWDDRSYWQVANTSSLNIKNPTHQLNVTGLRYPNTMYDLRVFMRSPMAKGEHMWSQPASITFRTKPTIPGAAPKTDIGSFEVMTVGLNMRDIYVYWQHIPEYMYNGENFNYVVSVEEDGVPRNIPANETTAAYAKFRGLSLNSYYFKIVSANQEGISKDYSEVFVPSQANSLAEPLSFTKIAFDHRIYELSWKHPATNYAAITSYTIFWCDNKKDRPYQCTGTLNWMRVPRDVTIKNITVPEDKIYQFAISANTDKESSGMVWASCTVIHNRVLGKMKSVWINRIGPTFIEVGWKLECSDRIGMVTGFVISYCPIGSPTEPKCKVEAKNTTIKGDGMTIRGNVTNLTPYTTYMVMVAVMTKGTLGLWSDRQYNTTLEAAPDIPPQNVTVSEVTNTTMLVKWMPPSSMNGVLRYYMVHYNEHERRVEGTKGALNTQLLLTKLRSYTVYNVSVSACTVTCSTQSPPIEVRTAIGVPGKIEKPSVTFMNSSQVVVTWNPPKDQAGRLDKYEVRMIDKNDNTSQLIDTTDTKKQIPIKECDSGGPHHIYMVDVRAVNFANDTVFYGPWSDVGEGNCYTASQVIPLWIIMWVTLFLICVAMGFFCVFLGSWMWKKWESMRFVEVKLPPGLETVSHVNKSLDPDHYTQLNLYGWSTVEKQVVAMPDQELLLHKKDELETGDHNSIGEVDAESSGCSSGHESVASSLTTGTHISSDSGTEVDPLHAQKTTSLDTVFTPATSLRQRNKTSSSSGSETGSGRWDHNQPYVMIGGSSSCLVKSTPNLTNGENNGAGYSMLVGPAVWRPATATSGYVSLSTTNNSSPPYVAHPPLWSDKEPAPSTIPTAPSKGYVMAGESAAPGYCRLDCVSSQRTDTDH